MRRILMLALSSAVVAALAAPAGAGSGYGPGQYQPGPKGGDQKTYTEADPASGKVVIFQHNTRQAAAVHCIGEGPRATLRIAHTVASEGLSTVSVGYSEAYMTEHPLINVLVTGSESDWLGHGTAFGPKAGESGTVDIRLAESPDVGEVVTITFGLQVHAGCMGHPTLLGLPGSRFIEGGQVVFNSVTIG